MNKLVIKELKNKTKKQCERCKEVKAENVLKLNGFKKIFVCDICVANFYKEIANSYFEENVSDTNVGEAGNDNNVATKEIVKDIGETKRCKQ